MMADWYAFKDPRQFYYGTYTMARARMQETAEADFDFVEERGLVGTYPDGGEARSPSKCCCRCAMSPGAAT